MVHSRPQQIQIQIQIQVQIQIQAFADVCVEVKWDEQSEGSGGLSSVAATLADNPPRGWRIYNNLKGNRVKFKRRGRLKRGKWARWI